MPQIYKYFLILCKINYNTTILPAFFNFVSKVFLAFCVQSNPFIYKENACTFVKTLFIFKATGLIQNGM